MQPHHTRHLERCGRQRPVQADLPACRLRLESQRARHRQQVRELRRCLPARIGEVQHHPVPDQRLDLSHRRNCELPLIPAQAGQKRVLVLTVVELDIPRVGIGRQRGIVAGIDDLVVPGVARIVAVAAAGVGEVAQHNRGRRQAVARIERHARRARTGGRVARIAHHHRSRDVDRRGIGMAGVGHAGLRRSAVAKAPQVCQRQVVVRVARTGRRELVDRVQRSVERRHAELGAGRQIAAGVVAVAAYLVAGRRIRQEDQVTEVAIEVALQADQAGLARSEVARHRLPLRSRAVVGQPPDEAAHKVGVEVVAHIGRRVRHRAVAGADVERAAHHRRIHADVVDDMAVAEDRFGITRRRLRQCAEYPRRAGTFARRIAIVAARRHLVNLLPRPAADITHPGRARARADAEAEGVAEPVRKDLLAGAGGGQRLGGVAGNAVRVRGKRVAGRNCVATGVDRVGANAQNLAVEIVCVVRRAGDDVRVADADIEVAVGAKVEVASVVDARVGGNIVDQNALGGWVNRVADHREARDAVARAGLVVGVGAVGAEAAAGGLARVVEIEIAVLGKARVERDAQQPAFAVTADGECERPLGQQRTILEDTHAGEVDVVAGAAAGLEDENAAIGSEGEVVGGEEAVHDQIIAENAALRGCGRRRVRRRLDQCVDRCIDRRARRRIRYRR